VHFSDYIRSVASSSIEQFTGNRDHLLSNFPNRHFARRVASMTTKLYTAPQGAFHAFQLFAWIRARIPREDVVDLNLEIRPIFRAVENIVGDVLNPKIEEDERNCRATIPFPVTTIAPQPVASCGRPGN